MAPPACDDVGAEEPLHETESEETSASPPPLDEYAPPLSHAPPVAIPSSHVRERPMAHATPAQSSSVLPHMPLLHAAPFAAPANVATAAQRVPSASAAPVAQGWVDCVDVEALEPGEEGEEEGVVQQGVALAPALSLIHI